MKPYPTTDILREMEYLFIYLFIGFVLLAALADTIAWIQIM